MFIYVLDGLDSIKIAVAYKDLSGNILTSPPQDAEDYIGLEPIYEEMPGWKDSTADVTEMEQLPANAIAYIKRLETILEIKISILSTGPERNSTIILEDPYGIKC